MTKNNKNPSNSFTLTSMMNNQTEQNDKPFPKPGLDGLSHINVHYNCGRTKLGRILSTYCVAHFTHPYFGPFKCVEGLLLYLKTGGVDDQFRTLTGAKAKAYYRKLLEESKVKNYTLLNEESLLISANYAKLKCNPTIAALFMESTEPFDMYYLHGPDNIPIRPNGAVPMLNSLTILRELMNSGKEPESLSNEEYAKMRIST